MDEELYIVLVGTILDGSTPYGPFVGREAALSWAENETSGEAWEISTLEKP